MVAWIVTWGKAQGEWGLCLDGKGTDGGKERNYLLFSDIICQALCDEYGDWRPRSPSTESLWPSHWESWSQAAVRDVLSRTEPPCLRSHPSQSGRHPGKHPAPASGIKVQPFRPYLGKFQWLILALKLPVGSAEAVGLHQSSNFPKSMSLFLFRK